MERKWLLLMRWGILASMIVNALLVIIILIIGQRSDCSQLRRLIQQNRRVGQPTSKALNRTLLSDLPQFRHVGYESTPLSLRLTHVVMPFHQSQVEQAIRNLESWRVFPPCQPAENGGVGDEAVWGDLNDEHLWWREMTVDPKMPLGRNISLLLFLNGQPDKAVEAELRLQFNNLPQSVRSCWSDMEVRWAKLTAEKDTYLTGSRSMFEVMLNGWIGLREAHYVLYMEPDARPIRPFWLSMLDAQTRWPNPPFWLKGSLFRGDPEAIKAHLLMNLFHINGNAIYNLGDPDFRNFYWHRVRDWVVRSKKELAYDTDFFRYMLDPANHAYARTIAHLFQHTELIQNQYHTNYSMSQLRANNHYVAIVHGGNPSQ